MSDFLNSKFDSVVDNGDGTFTVELDGYEAIINQNGTLIGDIQKSGPRPVVDNASIKITTDGTTVPGGLFQHETGLESDLIVTPSAITI